MWHDGAMAQARFPHEKVITVSDGEVIFEEGDNDREMFIIQSGEVEIVRNTLAGKVIITTLERGAFFGEMALLESLPRSATARSKGETRLVVVQPGGFLVKLRRDPTFAFELMQQLSRRLRLTHQWLDERYSKDNGPDSLIDTTIYDESMFS